MEVEPVFQDVAGQVEHGHLGMIQDIGIGRCHDAPVQADKDAVRVPLNPCIPGKSLFFEEIPEFPGKFRAV